MMEGKQIAGMALVGVLAALFLVVRSTGLEWDDGMVKGDRELAQRHREEGLLAVECRPQSLAKSSGGGRTTYHDPKLRDGSRIKLPAEVGNLWSPGNFHLYYYPGSSQLEMISRCENNACFYRQIHGEERGVEGFSSEGFAGVWSPQRLYTTEETKVRTHPLNGGGASFDFTLYDYRGGSGVWLEGTATVVSDTEAIYVSGGSQEFSIAFSMEDGELVLYSEEDELGILGSALKVNGRYTSAPRQVFDGYPLARVLDTRREREAVQLALGDELSCGLRSRLSGKQAERQDDGSVVYRDEEDGDCIVLREGSVEAVVINGKRFALAEKLSPSDYRAYRSSAAAYLEEDIFSAPLVGRQNMEIMAFYRDELWDWTDGMAKPFEIPYIRVDLDGDGAEEYLLRMDCPDSDGHGYAAALTLRDGEWEEIRLPDGSLDGGVRLSLLTERSEGFCSLEVKGERERVLVYDGDGSYRDALSQLD